MKVSVIIPIYNQEKYLFDCLESLHRQTLKEIEFILVNDGSTDTSQQICEDFVNKDSRFILINQENGGSASARKTGMLKATGEYLGFIDSDDWAEEDMFEKLYSCAKEFDVDIVFCNCYRNFIDRQEKCGKQMREGYYNRKQILTEILPYSLAGIDSKGRNKVIRWANYLRLYRHSLIKEYNVYNDPRFRRCQDLQITFEATLYAQSYYYLDEEYLYHNRVVENSQSRGYTVNFWKKLNILIEKLYQDVYEFKELDLSKQMDLSTFFFATQAIFNEDKHDVSKKEKFDNFSEIYNDSLVENALKTIPINKLNKVNQLYYNGLQNKDNKILLKAIKEEIKQKNKNSFKSKLLKNKFLKLVWEKISKK